MRRIVFFAFIIFIFSSNSFAQNSTNDLPKIEHDTLYTSSGYNITENQEIKIGIGTMPDGDFRYIRVNAASLFAYSSSSGYNGLANQANSLPRNQSGLKYKIKKIEKRGNAKHGYVYYAKITLGITNYEIDVENAIATGEINVPDEFKSKPIQAENKPQISVADELTKLKKLYDDSVLTKDEYELQKKKLLGGN